jgi:hypothetical protein
MLEVRDGRLVRDVFKNYRRLRICDSHGALARVVNRSSGIDTPAHPLGFRWLLRRLTVDDRSTGECDQHNQSRGVTEHRRV